MKNNLGFSLLELLVSVVILAIGLLGMAALQSNSMRFNHDAHLRAVAISQVNTMIDRMRANNQGIEDGNYNSLSGIPNPAPTCAGSSCTPAEVAQLDIFNWNTANAAVLPAGQGSITAAGSLHTITIRWDNSRSGATGTGCSGDPAVDLMCLTMTVRM